MGKDCGLVFHEDSGNTDTFRGHVKLENIPSKDNSACNMRPSECSSVYNLN